MSKTIVIIGHPYWNDSVANKAIVEEFVRLNPDAKVSNIAELYHDGHGGDKLKGKRFIVSFTAGGSADMYSRYGVQKMTIDDLMPPFAGIPNHCGMQWGGYVFSGGMMTAGNTDEENSILLGRAKAHADRLTNLVNRQA